MPFLTMAHQPDVSSTMLVEQSPDKWVLQVRSALSALEYEIRFTYGENAYSTSEEFQALVVDYMQKNISVAFDGQRVDLLNGYAKLGHESSVVFEIYDAPKSLNIIEVRNSAFKDISKNQSALMVFKKDVAKEQFVLNVANKHTAKLKFENTKFVQLNTNIAKSSFPLIPSATFGIMALLLIATGIIYYRGKNRAQDAL